MSACSMDWRRARQALRVNRAWPGVFLAPLGLGDAGIGRVMIEDVRTSAKGVGGGRKRPVAGQKWPWLRFPGLTGVLSGGPEKDALWRSCDLVSSTISAKSASDRMDSGLGTDGPTSVSGAVTETIPYRHASRAAHRACGLRPPHGQPGRSRLQVASRHPTDRPAAPQESAETPQ